MILGPAPAVPALIAPAACTVPQVPIVLPSAAEIAQVPALTGTDPGLLRGSDPLTSVLPF